MFGWVSVISVFVFFQAEDGIRDLVRSRGLGDVYKRQEQAAPDPRRFIEDIEARRAERRRCVAAAGRERRLSLIHI